MTTPTLTSSVKKTREALAIRATALADLQTAAKAGKMGNDGMQDRMKDVMWANGIVAREAEALGVTPEWLIAISE